MLRSARACDSPGHPPGGAVTHCDVAVGEVITIATTKIAQAGETTSVQLVTNVSLVTLATNTGILLAGPAMTLGGRCLSIRLNATVHGMTAGDGPHALYITDKSLSLLEFEEYLEAGGPVNPEDTVSAERASRGRRLRYLGLLIPSGNGTVSGLSLMDLSLGGLRFTRSSAGWQFVIYNRGKAMETGSVGRVWASVFLRWDKSN